MSELVQSLLRCKVVGDTLFLPPISEGMLPNYPEVKKALLNAGAKYKRNTFVFPNDAKPYVDRLTNGESINIKKEFQFFATPAPLAARMVKMANINYDHEILEPSAGQGAIIKEIHKVLPSKEVCWCELMPENMQVIFKIPNTVFMYEDFMEHNVRFKYDRIIANPPFTKNQDIDHIRKMYEVTKPGGVIITLASTSWQRGGQKKQTEFREWLFNIGSTIEEIPENTFKESGTSIKTVLITIPKM